MKKILFYFFLIFLVGLIFTSCYITFPELSIVDNNTNNNSNNNSNNFENLSMAGKNKQRLLNYLESEVWGKKTLSGQMDLTWDDTIDMLNKVYTSTGKYPAISGYDFMNVGLSGWSGAKQTDEAIAWWNNAKNTGKHGIVTICWHWREPGQSGGNFYSSLSDKSASEQTTFTIPMKNGVLDTSHSNFSKIKSDLDKVATELTKLKNAGVPVLWRPLHEAGGDPQWDNPWFWWGATGNTKTERATAYKALYIYMYNYFTNTKGLDNLIWVWNGQVKEYYPGDAYVDIISEDIYVNNHNSQVSKFNSAKQYTSTNKMIALSENGCIPLPDNMANDNAKWLWFMTWNDGNTSGSNSSNFWEGDYYNDDSVKNTVYKHNNIITLDELPDLTSYPLQ